MKIHSRHLHAPLCGIFGPHSVNVVLHYASLIRAKSPTNCDAHLTESNFQTRSSVCDVSAYYEEGVFYVTTSAKSNKMKQIAQNKEVAFSVCFEGIYGHGIGENLGWVLEPKNAALRTKLREVFADWYDDANNEQDENCVILAIRITSATIFRDHGVVRYKLDFVNKVEVES